MTDVGELVLRIKADAAQLEREMKRAGGIVQQNAGGMEKSFGRLKSELLSLVPAISAVGFVAFGKHAIDAAGRMNDLAARIGFTASTLSALEIPLAASGASLDEFTGAVNRMNNLVGEAALGNEQAIKAFDNLGLSVDKLRKLTPEDQFYEIASAIGQVKDQSAQTEAGMNIFGRSFSTLLPLLKEYGGDMRTAVKEQSKLNDGLSQETIDRIDRFGDTLSAAGIKIRNAFLEAFGAILKVIETIPKADKMADETASRYDLGGGGIKTDGKDFKFKIGTQSASTSPAAVIGTEQYGPEYQPPTAKGSNAALLARIKALEDALKATKKQTAETEKLTEKTKELDQAAIEAAQTQAMFHDRLTRGLTDVVFSANSAADAFRGLAEQIARAAFERKVAGPLIDGLIGSSGTTGGGLLGSLLPSASSLFGGFFADGGSPPVGMPSIVGERGPEIFVPNTRGTVIPNHALGGSTTAITHVWQIQSGVTRQELASIIPLIESRSTAATIAALQQGGTASKVTGLRN